jgi:hypothetical protein
MNICKIYNVDANWIIGIAPEPFKGSKNIKKQFNQYLKDQKTVPKTVHKPL